MMAVRAVLYCCAAQCCAAATVRVACVCFHRGHQKRCFIQKVLQNLTTNNNILVMYLVKSVQVLILEKATYHAGRYV